MQPDREGVILSIKSLIADKEFVTAVANRELSMGGWLSDHSGAISELNNEISNLILILNKLCAQVPEKQKLLGSDWLHNAMPTESTAPFPECETPSLKEFVDYCAQIGLAAEWYSTEKWWIADAALWKKKENWRSYAQPNQRIDRSIGTANEGRASDYDGLG